MLPFLTFYHQSNPFLDVSRTHIQHMTLKTSPSMSFGQEFLNQEKTFVVELPLEHAYFADSS